MPETKLIRLVSANGGIPQSMKTYRTINVTQMGSGRDTFNGPHHKVIRVALPQNVVLGRPAQDKIPDISSPRSDDDVDGASLSKNALLARENRLKKKRYINGLEENLAVAKKENELLKDKLKEKDLTIDQLQKEISYFKSILANVQEISGLIKTIKQESHIPMSTSLRPSVHPMKRKSVAELPMIDDSKRIKIERTSESSSCMSAIHDDEDSYDWMPSSPSCPTQLDAESLDVLSNFSEEDINLFGDDTLLPEPTRQTVPFSAGICLHVFNKQMSLEFCAACATRAQEKWSSQV
ncbi:uncharacterized protein LOC130696105 [Daphnia carinata]|uniref:uncharacterized protein LOC130696105 n=1 Tax=Daphnia carinata TaxID=120202 RepID=UPI00257D0BF4|nr:uncharacterized protein LOC130696105 [Daphnia carinata]